MFYRRLSDEELHHEYCDEKDYQIRNKILTQIWENHFGYVLKGIINLFSPPLSLEEIQDVCADIFALSLPKYLNTLCKRQELVKNLRALSITIGKRKCFRVLRNQKKSTSLVENMLNSEKGLENDVQFYDNQELLENENPLTYSDVTLLALGLLSENQRLCLILHEFQGFTYEEIASKLLLDYTQVRGGITHGRAKLKEVLSSFSFEKFENEIITNSLQQFLSNFFNDNLSIISQNQLITCAIYLLNEQEAKIFKWYYIDNRSLIEIYRKIDDRNAPKILEKAQNKVVAMLKSYFEFHNSKDISIFN
jgi:DNA-directed RNA polymerase specialized sigma24 family protein